MFAMISGMLGVAGGGLSAFGSYAGGMAQRRTAEYNSRILQQKARMVEQVSAEETSQMHKEGRRLKASQTSGYAKSGAMIGSGTPLMVLAEQAGEMEMDVLKQRRNRAIEAQGLRSQAEMLRIQGKQASRAGIIGAGTALLGTAGKAGMAMGSPGGGGASGPQQTGVATGSYGGGFSIPSYQKSSQMTPYKF